jgi:hypothetical protein
MGKKIHRKCGGTIKSGKCTKCGKTWGIVGRMFSGEIEDKREGFDEREYRKRIKDGRDIT